MNGSRLRGFAFVSIGAACVAVPLLYLSWHHSHKGLILRAGIRNHSLSTSLNPAGRVDALSVEVVAESARRLGITLRWVDCPEGPDAALSSKKVDIWPMAMVLPERKSHFYITAPWLVGERCLVTKGSPPAKWKGLRVAYGLGPESQVLAIAPDSKPIHGEGDVAAIGAVCKGHADAAFVLTQSLGAFVLRKPEGCEEADFRITHVNGKSLKLGIGSTFEAAREADELRVEIGNMTEEGALEKIFSKYSVYSMAGTTGIYELMGAERRTRAFELGAGSLIVALAISLWQVWRVRDARQAAVKANGAKSQFLANMSHEIRTPLNGIVGLTELLGKSELSPDQRDIVTLILNSSESLTTIVNDILDFSKIEAGGMSIEEVTFDLPATVEGAVRLFTPSAERKGLRAECRIGPEVPRIIQGDPLRLRQILLNLLSNAIKFTEKGSVRVEVSMAADTEEGRAVLFRVIDTGIGIEPLVSKKLFRAFSQADSATTRKFGGTGLGLAISLRLVTLMGGSIGMESEPGIGSAFWFLIPARAAPAESAAPAALAVLQEKAAAAPRPADCRILVVEDNPVNQIVASRALGALGYSADIAAGGEAALDALRRRQFDLILMDCQMPGMDGYETAAEIRRREGGRKRTPIIAMTANAIEGDRERCIAAGMDDYLSKPFRIAALESILQRWLPPEPERPVA